MVREVLVGRLDQVAVRSRRRIRLQSRRRSRLVVEVRLRLLQAILGLQGRFLEGHVGSTL
jgi:hypothetical protein